LASWSSNNGGVATVGNAAGTKGVATGKNVGMATITANYLGVSGSAALTVTAKTLNAILVTPIEANAHAPAGTTLDFTATGIYSDNTTQDLTTSVDWATEPPSTPIATISNVGGEQGRASALEVGTTSITATFTVSPGVTVVGTRLFTVEAPNLDSVVVQVASPIMPVGTTQAIFAIAHYSNGDFADVTEQATWSSQFSARLTISNAPGSQGVASAVSPGDSIITATFGGVSGTSTVTVSSATLNTIAVMPASPTIANGTSVQFTAIGTYSDSSTVDLTEAAGLTWLTTPVSSAVVTISNTSGTKGKATGTSVGGPIPISAVFTPASGPVVTGNAQITVGTATLSSVTVEAVITGGDGGTTGSATIARGTTQQFVATGHLSNGTTQDLTTQVQWGSGTTSVATVSNLAGSEGVATGNAAGTSSISASFNGMTGAATLTVTAATLTGIAVIPAGTNLAIGANLQYHAIGSYSDTTTQDITWDVTPAGIATIANAPGTPGLAHGVAAGTATISAAVGLMTGSTGVTVTP
jgi:hypothetical protein